MTTRFLTTDQNGNGDQTYWDINGYFLHGPSGEKLNLGGGNTTVTASNEIVQIGTSYIRIPQGVSNERPIIPDSYIGMMRYLTTDNILEYFNGQTNTWIPISLPSPTISSITPNYISFDTSGQETNSNTYTLTGSNFNIEPGGISVEVIGNNGAGTILLPDSNSASSETSATFTFDPSGTEQLIGISNELPFAVKLTNTNSGFSSTLNNAIIATNAGPEFTQPSVFTPFSFQTFAVQDPSAHFTVGGIDLSAPTHYPLDFSFVSGTAGGFNVAGGDISSISDFSSIVQVPAGYRLSATASSYNFTMRVTDASNAFSDANYTLTLADPTITSIDPTIVSKVDLPIDISVNGDYFIRDTNVVLYNQSTGISAEFNDISYNSTTSLTINDLSSNAGVGVYDICINNFISPYQSFPNTLTITDKFLFTQTGGSVTYLDTVSGPASTISEATASTTSTSSVLITYTSGSGTFVPSSSNFFNVKTQFLVVGGGGGGGASAWTTSGATGAGGGAGEVIEGYMELTNGTTYNISVGNGGTGIANGQSQNSTNGGNSSFSTYTAVGGGYGATTNNGSTNPGGNGGSGGGGAYEGQLSTRSGSSTATYYGNSGGTCSVTSFGAGGGGGASEIGGNATTSLGGDGGDGIELAISGNNTYYGGGGGGGAFGFNGGSGGQGGGGAGGANTPSGGTGSPGTVNTGGGGGGGTYNGSHSGGGNGGSGIVILRFPYWKNLSFTNLNILNITATTGVYDVTYVDSGNNVVFYPKENGYTVVTFKINNGASNGSFTFSPNNNLSSNVEYLIIAGGGSGGGGTSDQVGSGGGGAGGYILGINSSGPLTGELSGGPSTALSPISFSSSVTYSVTVGKGGTGPSGNTVGQNGSNSILSGSGLSTITAIGGGGGSDSGGGASPGQNGGSGGGAGAYASSAGTGTSNQGNNGGKTGGTIAGGGGGGGAGTAGSTATGGGGSPAGTGGPGGNGLQSAIEGGPTKYRAGGGGGGSYTTSAVSKGGTGGLGGGGNGGIANTGQVNEGMNGAANTGSGGGGVSLGGGNTNSDTGGNGGSGVIILRFPSFA